MISFGDLYDHEGTFINIFIFILSKDTVLLIIFECMSDN